MQSKHVHAFKPPREVKMKGYFSHSLHNRGQRRQPKDQQCVSLTDSAPQGSLVSSFLQPCVKAGVCKSTIMPECLSEVGFFFVGVYASEQCRVSIWLLTLVFCEPSSYQEGHEKAFSLLSTLTACTDKRYMVQRVTFTALIPSSTQPFTK